jgi:hypothetical protein
MLSLELLLGSIDYRHLGILDFNLASLVDTHRSGRLRCHSLPGSHEQLERGGKFEFL